MTDYPVGTVGIAGNHAIYHKGDEYWEVSGMPGTYHIEDIEHDMDVTILDVPST